MHNAVFSSMGINGVYVPMQVREVEQAITGLKALGFRGASVTVPHKETVMAYLDYVDPIADQIGAVNTLVCEKGQDGITTLVKGLNTDWLGALRALEQVMSPKGSHIVIMGAGGSAKAVGYGLKKAGAQITIANRTEKKGQQLAQWLDADFILPETVADIKHADVLINTTSVGMEPDYNSIVINPELLPKFKTVMDIVYAPLETRLLREATRAGCKTIDGLSMLLYQGAAQFEAWTGKTPPLEVMRAALMQALSTAKK